MTLQDVSHNIVYSNDNGRIHGGGPRGVSIAWHFVFVLFTLIRDGLSRVDSGTAPGGFSNGGGAGPQQSGGVSLSLSAADVTPAGSPDPSSLTVLQPANNNQNNGTVYAASAPTMLPGFTTHYATAGKLRATLYNNIIVHHAVVDSVDDNLYIVMLHVNVLI